MGVKEASKILYPTRALPDSLKEIRGQYSNDQTVLGGVDASIWMVAVLNHKDALEQQFMEPQIPVTAVAQYIRDFCMLLIANNIQPVLVFDGQRVPLKRTTNEKRYKNLKLENQKLEAMYQQSNSDNHDDNDEEEGEGEDSSDRIGCQN